MDKSKIEVQKLNDSSQPLLHKTDVSGSASRKPNPYQLIWYKQGWSENRVRKNNLKYWEWEIVHNGFKCP